MNNNDKPKNKLDHARDLQVWIWSNKPAVKETTNFLFNKILREDKFGGLKEKRLKDNLRVVLTDLFVTHKNDKKMYIIVSRNKNDYRSHSYYTKIYLKYDYMVFILDFLIENGYIEYHRGVYTPRFQRKPRIRWTEKLVRLFRKYDKPGGVVIWRKPPIFLRNKDKKDIDFNVDLEWSIRLIYNTSKINRYLKKHKIEHRDILGDPTDIVTEEMYASSSKYHRVFNNSRFDHGGRFYGHWSQHIESHERIFISIDDMFTVELDYSCLHISMLYGLEEMTPPPGDQYSLPGISASYRKVIKVAVNIALNANTARSAMSAIRDEMHKFCDETDLPFIRPKILLRAIFAKHQAIKKYFCSGYGLRLQFLDSMIAEKIMLTLGEEGIGCLCIHDSFIVADKYEAILRDLMEEFFCEMFGFLPKITAKAISFFC